MPGLGIGKALASLAFRHLVAHGYDEAIVRTVEGYERGIAFFEGMGWKRDGGVRDNGCRIGLRRPCLSMNLPAGAPMLLPRISLDDLKTEVLARIDSVRKS